MYFIVIFYEHFFDKGKHNIIGRNLKYFVYIVVSALTMFLLLLFLDDNFLKIPYFYIKGGSVLILLPLAAFLISFPKFISSFLKTAPYFFYVELLQELTAVQLGYWSFPGKHIIGWMSFAGYRFPYEEFFFFIMIFAMSVLAYFEFFDDDKIREKRRN